MNTKLELTQYLIDKLGLISPKDRSFKSWVHKIWQNPRSKDHGGLRLTADGFELFTKADIKYYEVRFEEPLIHLTNDFILWIDNTFNCPFYLTRLKIYFFSEKPAVQLVLFSGDLYKYYTAHKRFTEKQLDNSQH